MKSTKNPKEFKSLVRTATAIEIRGGKIPAIMEETLQESINTLQFNVYPGTCETCGKLCSGAWHPLGENHSAVWCIDCILAYWNPEEVVVLK